jgi:hypothetical protein
VALTLDGKAHQGRPPIGDWERLALPAPPHQCKTDHRLTTGIPVNGCEQTPSNASENIEFILRMG